MTAIAFRPQALAARAGMDDLAGAMQVTDSQTRRTVVAMALALVATVIASAFVVVPIKVDGSGILIDRSGELLVPVPAGADGIVEVLLVQPGDRIEANQPIGRLRLPELEAAIDKATREIYLQESEFSSFDAIEKAEASSTQAILEQKKTEATRRIADLEVRLTLLREREAGQVLLRQKGVTSEAQTLQARIAVQEVTESLAQAKAELSATDARLQEDTNRRKNQRFQRLVKLDQARTDLAALQLNHLGRQTLISPVGGVIAEIGASAGAMVARGSPIVNVVASEAGSHNDLTAIVYVPLGNGKQVKVGDEVLLAPAASDAEHDRIRGKVTDVSPTAVTATALKRSLGNEQLALLATRSGPAFSVHVALEASATAPSGYLWTSGNGPDVALSRGTPVGAQITVEKRRLLSLAIPALKRIFGLADRTSWASAP